jgi:hypothetical protein
VGYIDIVDRHVALMNGKCGFCGEPLTKAQHEDRIDIGGGREASTRTENVPFCARCKTYWPAQSVAALTEEAVRMRGLTGR